MSVTKIAINLLPPEILSRQLKKASFYKIQAVGVTIILILVFLTSLTVVMRILQSHNISVVQAQVTQTQHRVSDLKDTQVALLLLNDRLKVINEYWGVPSKQSSLYKLIDKLIPPAVVVNAITVSRSGEVVFLALVPDSVSLDNLVDNLTTRQSNEDKISQISIESLNRSRDGLYRVSFKVKPK